ncbi:MAG: NAD-dependent epimerase/dehydratase family protein [Opitutales bacterium]|nr:NAD-dependent epimerase/dehydratase family protein [Opitutales bacterium]
MQPQNLPILITGGNGNIARLLAKRLLKDGHSVTCLDITDPNTDSTVEGVDYFTGDICDGPLMEEILKYRSPKIVFHLASLLSGSSEADRKRAFQVNAQSTFNLLELALANGKPRILFPGTGASYGSDIPANVPEDQPQWPENIYGVTKIFNERLGAYYTMTHGMDFRCLRPPLVLSPYAPPAALTAYASHAYVAAAKGEPFVFPVSPDIGMSTIYIEDLVEGFVQLAYADQGQLSRHAYILHAFCPSAQEIADSIVKLRPNFQYSFEPDNVVESLLKTAAKVFQDASARHDWGWNPISDLDDCSQAIFKLLEPRQKLA